MENYSQMKKLERIIVSCMLVFAVIVVVAVYSFVVRGRVRAENQRYNEFIQTLESRQSELQNSVDFMSTDQYLEEQARNRLGMVKDGEILYVFD